MSIFEAIINFFDEAEDLELSQEKLTGVVKTPVFSDLETSEDHDIIKKISESYALSTKDAEEFLEVNQSIQHSLSKFADVETLSNIDNYIDDFGADPKRLIGLVNNIKGIYGEHEVFEAFQNQVPTNYQLLRSYVTNAKDVDFEMFNESGDVVERFQVKISSNPRYITDTREELSDDITIITTDDAIESIIAEHGDLPDGIISVGLSSEEITHQVEKAINILSSTEPKYDALLRDPVISEHMQEDFNPFELES